MRTEEKWQPPRWLAWTPLLLGACGVMSAAVYMWQRSELWMPHRLERLIQHNLELLGAATLICGVAGMIVAVLLDRLLGKSAILTAGTVVTIVAAIMTLLLPL